MTGPTGKAQSNDFSGDAPVTDPSLDAFRRWPFAERVAATIAARRDTGSLVISINGPWGDGKTTVLNFIEQALKDHEHVIPIKFNPWRFGDETSMLLGFFQQLAAPIGAKLKTGAEKFGEAFRKYGEAASSVTLTAGPLAATGAAVNAAASLIPVADIETQKERIEKALSEAGKRVVVFVDDIDRLDKNEIYALFRLLKLTADFACTTYVLAFDEEIVASSLAERYGETRASAGRGFIEKIVQVPLRLPVVDKTSLRDLCFKGVSEAIDQNGFDLSKHAASTLPARAPDSFGVIA